MGGSVSRGVWGSGEGVAFLGWRLNLAYGERFRCHPPRSAPSMLSFVCPAPSCASEETVVTFQGRKPPVGTGPQTSNCRTGPRRKVGRYQDSPVRREALRAREGERS